MHMGTERNVCWCLWLEWSKFCQQILLNSENAMQFALALWLLCMCLHFWETPPSVCVCLYPGVTLELPQSELAFYSVSAPLIYLSSHKCFLRCSARNGNCRTYPTVLQTLLIGILGRDPAPPPYTLLLLIYANDLCSSEKMEFTLQPKWPRILLKYAGSLEYHGSCDSYSNAFLETHPMTNLTEGILFKTRALSIESAMHFTSVSWGRGNEEFSDPLFSGSYQNILTAQAGTFIPVLLCIPMLPM